jgi:hypothetical protein
LGFDRARIAKEFWIKEFEEPAFDKDGSPIGLKKMMLAEALPVTIEGGD